MNRACTPAALGLHASAPRLLVSVLALALALAGCGGGSSSDTAAPPAPPSAPAVTAPAWVTAGQAGYTASVPALAGVTYAWTATGATVNSGAATPSISFTPGASGSAVLTCTLTNGVGSSAGSATAAILPLPATPVITAPAYVTAGESGYAATVPAQAGVTWTWTVSGGTINSGAETDAIRFTAGPGGSVSLGCTATNAASSGASGSATAQVVDAPALPVISAPSPVTAGQPGYAASVPTQAGATYAWTISGGTLTAGATTPAVTFTPAASGAVTLGCTVRNAAGTPSAPASAAADIVPAPDLPVITAPAYVTASEAGYAASVPAQPGSGYAWTILGGTITSGAGSSAIVFTPDPTGNVILGCTVTNAAGTPSIPATTSAIIVPPPATPVITAPAHVTAGLAGATASVPAQGGASYAWTISGGAITAGAGTDAVTFTPGSSGTVALACTVSNAAGTPSAAGTGSSAIVPAPDLPVVTAPAFVTASQAGAAASVPAQAGVSWAWTITGGAITAGAATPTVTFTPDPSGVVTLSCTATNAAGTASAPGTSASTIVPAPVVTSFQAGQGATGPWAGAVHVRRGQTAWLQAQFAAGPGGTASIDAGVGAVSSLSPVQTAALTADTTFTLSVANAAGTTATAQATVGMARLSVYAGAVTGLGYLDGTGADARFNGPYGAAAVAPSGNVYVADTANNLIRKITPAGVVTTVAGTAPVYGAYGSAGFCDGVGPAAKFNSPRSVAVDSTETNLYVADSYNSVIRKIQLSTGAVTTFAGYADSYGSACSFGRRDFRDGTGVGGWGSGAPAFFMPSGVAIDAADANLYVADTYNSAIRKITLPGAVVTTLAGWTGGVAPPGPYPMYWGQGYADGAAIGAARFSYPTGVAVDPGGPIYVADYYNNAVRFIWNGNVGTLAGQSTPGSSDGAATTAARFYYPSSVTATPDAVYVTDANNDTIRSIKGSAISAGGLVTPGTVATVAGLAGSAAWVDGVGSAARFSVPQGIATDGASLFVADTQNHVIRKLDPSTGAATTLAGTGPGGGATDSPPRFANPRGMVMDSAGTLFVADAYNHAVRAVALDGTTRTLAGGGAPGFGDGVGAEARFNQPHGLALDPTQQFLYVVDTYNHAVRKIAISSGLVTTVAGWTGGIAFPGPYSAAAGYQDDSTPWVATTAMFNTPYGIAVDAAGDVFVADSGNAAIRKIDTLGRVSVFAGTITSGTLPGPYVAGTGTADGRGTFASFNSVQGLAIDAAGNLFAGDTGNNLIRIVQPDATVTTIAGSGAWSWADGTGSAAAFRSPIGMAVGPGGQVYVADFSSAAVRMIVPVFAAGVPQPSPVTTVVGDPLHTAGGTVAGPLPGALYTPWGLATDPADGTLFITVPDGVMAAEVQ